MCGIELQIEERKKLMQNRFICATKEYNTFEKQVPAPYIRKSFISDSKTKGRIKIAVCGFYELYMNGRNITRGILSPYISNPQDYIYCDEYDVEFDEGENVLGILLGNGFQNNPGGHIWEFDKASFRSAPMVSLMAEFKNSKGEIVKIESDESFKTTPSPILADDYRFGETYDARCEISGWCEKGFDDSGWKNVMKVNSPGGEIRVCEATPIVVEEELKPVNIIKTKNGYVYDFGVSNSGVCRLKVKGKPGQEIVLRHADDFKDGEINIAGVWFVRKFWDRDKEIVHKDTYICKGLDEECYTPTFTYHGFRYVEVSGITEEQATKGLLTFVVFHSKLNTRGDFSCSDEVANTLQEMTRRSDVSNFHHFPTDCPQREKNGWTADAALSCEQTLLNFDPEVNYREWLRNICKAQNKEGALPGIIPTAGWGFEWGNGPAWDCILAYLPYFVYIYRGETEMIYESADSFIAYLKYLKTRMDEKGLLAIGLGDWCQVGQDGGGEPIAPLIVTDSIMAKDIADKIAFLFNAVGMTEQRDFALQFSEDIMNAIRENLIDFETMTVYGECQTCQAMAIFYNVLRENEKEVAFSKLLEYIRKEDDHMLVGVLGGRVIFHVLTQFGYSDLAYTMITRPDFPSYGNWIERGATTLWEVFTLENKSSMNHHFWGDISGWFIKCIAGIRLNPDGNDVNSVEIKPSFVKKLDNAKAYHIAPCGKISSAWERKNDKIILTLEIPEGMKSVINLEKGYVFSDKNTSKAATSGEYEIYKL